MKEHPILFSTPMVKALLAGKKTQTRRIINLRKGETIGSISAEGKVEEWIICDKDGDEIPLEFACPYGWDRLWVRETWAIGAYTHLKVADIIYKADDNHTTVNWNEWLEQHTKYGASSGNWDKWRPSIFMPRWASRINLEITDIRVQRLQKITADDILAEGIEHTDPLAPPDSEVMRNRFLATWDKINGKKYPWSKNCWVWAISFKVLKDG